MSHNRKITVYLHFFSKIYCYILMIFFSLFLLFPSGYARAEAQTGQEIESLSNAVLPGIYDSLSRATVTGVNDVGGLVGFVEGPAVTRTYAAGLVTGTGQHVGGLLGRKTSGSVNNSYWDTQATGQSASAGGESKTTQQMNHPHADNTYSGWDFNQTWASDANYALNNGYPYLRQTGFLGMTIEPLGVRDAGAQWRRVGTTTWRDSGATESSVPTGAQTVEFKDVSGWTKPANVSVTVVDGQTASFTGRYTQGQQTGTLQVSIEPSGARDAGAQWRRVGTTTWRDSGATENSVTTGAQTVEFKDVSGWTKPANVSVTVVDGQTAKVTETYTPPAIPLCIQPPDGLVSWWRGQDNAQDSIGGNHGTLMGASFATGMVGQAFSFDGGGDYVHISPSAGLDITGAITMAAWIRTNASTDGVIMIKGDPGCMIGSCSYGMWVDLDDSVGITLYGDDGVESFKSDASIISSGQWYHIVGVWDGTTGNTDNVRLYVNGSLAKSWTKGGGLNSNSGALAIGSHNNASGRLMNGRIDEAAIFNRALSASAIFSIYNAGSMGICNPSDTDHYTIAVSANPTEGGTVTGDGVYNEGASVTVTATPAQGWNFFNWIEGGQAVSLDAAYTFNASVNRTLVANFVQAPAVALFEAGPNMNTARMGHNAVTLPDGRVALFGGHGTGFVSLSSAELWSSSTAAFDTLNMVYPHDAPAFVQLIDGRYLLSGGSSDLGVPNYATSEVFNPYDNTFAAVGDMVRFRASGGGAAMSDGRVLIASAWWVHNDANIYGELYDPGSRTFSEVGPFSAARASAIVLPTTDGQAVVLGGSPPQGGVSDQPVALFNPATGAISTLQNMLFEGESGWMAYHELRPVTAQKMADGRYLWLASRLVNGVTSYRLFTFNPETRAIIAFATQPVLPDSTSAALFQVVVDQSRDKAHVVAQLPPGGTPFPDIAVYSVDLASGVLTRSSNSHSLDYSLGGAGIVSLADGRLMITGGTTRDNFTPVNRTLLITPPATSTEIIFQPGPGLNDGTDDGSINAGKDAYFYNCSGNWSGTSNLLFGNARSNCNECNAKGYIQFNISTLPDTVEHVYLVVNHFPHSQDCYSMCEANFYFYPVLTSWDEMSPPVEPPTEGDPIYGPINITFPNDFGKMEYDITGIYRQWKNGTVPNHGLVIYSPDVGCNNAAVSWIVHSSDSTEIEKRPYLKIISSQSEPGKKGDVNGDSNVDLTDLMLALRILAGYPVTDIALAADVNGDGKIDMAEVIYIMQTVAVF